MQKHTPPPPQEADSWPLSLSTDDQILLELGNPDGFVGEEKTRFISGLRELLQQFKADNVKDFDTIARGIIEFRRKVLGDPYRVITLGHVKI